MQLSWVQYRAQGRRVREKERPQTWEQAQERKQKRTREREWEREREREWESELARARVEPQENLQRSLRRAAPQQLPRWPPSPPWLSLSPSLPSLPRMAETFDQQSVSSPPIGSP